MNRVLPALVLVFALAFFFVSERISFLPASEHEPTTVSFWAWSTPGSTMLQLKQEFEEKHPDIRVEVQTVPWESLQEKTLWAVAANSNVPDVIVGSSEWMGGLVSNGALDPLDEYLDRGFFARYFPTTLGIYQFPEVRREKPEWRGRARQYGIPLDLDLMIVFYRADVLNPLMAKLGMSDFPATWEQFQKLGQAVREQYRDDVPAKYLLHLDPDDFVPFSMAFLPASGASFLDRNLSRAVFNSPEGIAAFDFLRQLLQTRSAMRWERKTNEDPAILYKTERTFAHVAGPWYAKYLEIKAPELAGKWHVALFPRRQGISTSCGLGGACLAMPYNAPHKKEAIELIRFMATDRFALAYFSRVGSPPPQVSAWKDPVFDQPVAYFGGQEIYHVVKHAIETARPLQLMPSSEVTKGPVRWAMREIAVGAKPVIPTLEHAVHWADRILQSEH